MYNRDISPVLQLVRALLLGRTWNNQLRFQNMLSPRPYPKPCLPGGSANKASGNYYLGRDARRTVQPNQDLQALIGDGSTSGSSMPPTPGKTYKWDM